MALGSKSGHNMASIASENFPRQSLDSRANSGETPPSPTRRAFKSRESRLSSKMMEKVEAKIMLVTDNLDSYHESK
jgi:hypothetical protein